MSEKHTKSSQHPERSGAAKKEYVKPSVNSEPIYETLALACAKRPGQGGRCRGMPRRS